MSLTKPKAKAICRDCWDEITGSISLSRSEMSEWASERLLIRAEGSLTQTCVERHRLKRGLGRLPQHDVFVVFDGSRMLGEMEVRSFTRDHNFETRNKEILLELLDGTKRIHPERSV